ncbi:MAG: choice-of-anchor V domain-containing protein [Chitinophagaceae bacterium]
MKKLSSFLVIIAVAILLQSGIKGVNFSSVPPQGYTGASGEYCNNCHGSFALNSGGGNVTVSGLPTTGYVPGQAYNFTLTIAHGSSNRTRWGFSIKATNSNGADVGTFSSTNNNAAVNGTELSHNNAVSTAASNSYTYQNLRWTAPNNSTNNPVTFYFVGNAANGSGSSGDFIYSSSSVIALPIELKSFQANVIKEQVQLQWQTSSEINADYFVVEKSTDGQVFTALSNVKAAGNSTTNQSYSYVDNQVAYFNRTIFYRLKQVDKDGSFKYSKTVIATIQSSHNVVVNKMFPTITKPGATMYADVTSKTNTTIRITLTNSLGKTLQVIQQNVQSGNQKIAINISATLRAERIWATFTDNEGAKQTMPIILMP